MPARRFRPFALLATFALVTLTAPHALAQGPPDGAALIAAQRTAMQPLAFMDGVWRGPAWTILQDGTRHEVTQTERIGPLLGSSLKVIEGRGYDAEGKVSFNAFGILSFDARRKTYALRSYAMGLAGDFPVTPTADGYVWEIPAGPATLRYTATVKDGKWREIGERVQPGRDPVQFFEMNLVRLSDSPWPAAGAVEAH